LTIFVGVTGGLIETKYISDFIMFYLCDDPVIIFCFRAKVNKGIGIENYHYLNDGLWQMKPVK
jgi:hypothetical protein